MATHSSTLVWRIPVDRGAWRATVHGVAKSRTQLSNWEREHTPHLASTAVRVPLVCSGLFQCHLFLNNYDEFQLIHHQIFVCFRTRTLNSSVIKAIHKPEAWRRERKFLTLGAEFISSHPSFISLRLFFVKLGKVPFPRRTTWEQTSHMRKAKSSPQGKNQRSILDWSPLKINGNLLFFKCITFLNWLEPNGWTRTFQTA